MNYHVLAVLMFTMFILLEVSCFTFLFLAMAKFVVKGLTGDRSQKVFICAGDLLELREEMKRKLKLPDGVYNVSTAVLFSYK